MWGAIASIGSSLLGGLFGSSANNKAAKAAAAAAQKAADLNTAAINKYIDLIEKGYPEQRAAIESGYKEAMDGFKASFAEQMQLLGVTTEEMDEILSGSYDEALQSVMGASKEALAELRGIRIDNAPGMQFLRQTVANPERLTDEQRYELDQMRDRVDQNIRASGGLAGSGRSATAIMRQVEADATNDFMAQNRAQAMQAAGMMASADNMAAREAAALAERRGNTVAGLQQQRGDARAGLAKWQGENALSMMDLNAQRQGTLGVQKAESLVSMDQKKNDQLGAAYMNIGRTQADAAQQAGTAKANAATANGNLWGGTLGNIGATIASEMRDRRYSSVGA